MDKIFLQEVKVETRLGVPEWERMVEQTIILDIEIGYDLSKACQSDNVADTIDYGLVVNRIRETLPVARHHVGERGRIPRGVHRAARVLQVGPADRHFAATRAPALISS
mgnify:CR=1 FL=1